MPESPSGERSGSVKTYRVVHAPSVAIRAGPWGKKLGIKQCGALVHCDASRDGWVRLQGGLDGEEAWMLIHGAKMGLGTLLQQETMAERVVCGDLVRGAALLGRLPASCVSAGSGGTGSSLRIPVWSTTQFAQTLSRQYSEPHSYRSIPMRLDFSVHPSRFAVHIQFCLSSPVLWL